MKKVALLGVGLQGKTILYDLTRSDLVSEVIAADVDIEGLRAFTKKLPARKIRCVELDAADEAATANLLNEADVAIDVLPPRFCLPGLKGGAHWEPVPVVR